MKTIKSILIILIICYISINSQVQNKTGWKYADEILQSIVPPTFPDKKFNLESYGNHETLIKNIKPAIDKAINECSKAGGGTVVIPKGEYLCNGPINLKSNVNLYLEDDVVIKFSTDANDYLPAVFTRWEGVECHNYSALIYGIDLKNIAITGNGSFDGQASNRNWWAWSGSQRFGWSSGKPSQRETRPLLMKMNNEEVPADKRVFGNDGYLRPNFLQLINCKNILIEGVTFLNSPMWFIHPVLSENITIKNIKTVGKGPNNDGIDPESCKNVLIDGCYFDNGDDCIAIKSGRNADGRRINVPSENIIVRNSEMKDGHGGVSIGSEISGGCRNVYIENCTMDSPNLDRALRIKSNSYRGGTVENIYMRDVKVGVVSNAVVRMNMRYDPREGSNGKFTPTFRNITVERVTSRKSEFALELIGLENSPIQNVKITNCSFNGVDDGNSIENTENLILKNVLVNGKVIDKD